MITTTSVGILLKSYTPLEAEGRSSPNQHQPANQMRKGTLNNQRDVAHEGSTQNLGIDFKNRTCTDNKTTQLHIRKQLDTRAQQRDRVACVPTKQELKRVYFTWPSFFFSLLNFGDDFEQCSWLSCFSCSSLSTGSKYK
jgi:hypothetical protein